jgi:hypothetical protein
MLSPLMGSSTFIQHILHIFKLRPGADMQQDVYTASIVAPVQEDLAAARPVAEQDPESDFVGPADPAVDREGAIAAVVRLFLPRPDCGGPDPAACRRIHLHFVPETL